MEKILDWLVRVLATLSVLLGGTAFILFVLISVLRDLLVSRGALAIKAPSREASELGVDLLLKGDVQNAEKVPSSGVVS